MYTTLETRWFTEGDLPDGLCDRFGGCLGERSRFPARTDIYLRQPGRDDLGVKTREGQLELKQRLDSLGEFTLGDALAGVMERWTKWSFPLANDPSLDLEPAYWVAVTKTRRLWYVHRDAATAQVELSRLQVRERIWWSLSLEVTGPDAAAEAALLGTLERLLDGKALPALGLDAAAGYPLFLNRMALRTG